MDRSRYPVNGNGNSAINGRGIKRRRGLTRHQQVPVTFLDVTKPEVIAELKRREAARKNNEADYALVMFADAWDRQSLAWRVNALKLIATESDLSDIRFVLNAATS